MSSTQIALLGAFAGITIFIGLPIGRISGLKVSVSTLLNAASAGVLLFLLIETFVHGFEPVEEALLDVTTRTSGSWGEFMVRAVLFFGAFALGLMGLVGYNRQQWRRRKLRGKSDLVIKDPQELPHQRKFPVLSDTKRLSVLIAVSIGVHNFAEGLAIGQIAASDQLSLAVLLVVGFALHNATEGFGIVAPLAGETARPSWRFLLSVGVIAGLPTFLGTIIGQSFVNENLELLFLGLAGGSILYVVVTLVGLSFKHSNKEMLYVGLLAGVTLGSLTELILVSAGL